MAVNGAASEECKSEGAGREQRLEEALFGTLPPPRRLIMLIPLMRGSVGPQTSGSSTRL